MLVNHHATLQQPPMRNIWYEWSLVDCCKAKLSELSSISHFLCDNHTTIHSPHPRVTFYMWIICRFVYVLNIARLKAINKSTELLIYAVELSKIWIENLNVKCINVTPYFSFLKIDDSVPPSIHIMIYLGEKQGRTYETQVIINMSLWNFSYVRA